MGKGIGKVDGESGGGKWMGKVDAKVDGES